MDGQDVGTSQRSNVFLLETSYDADDDYGEDPRGTLRPGGGPSRGTDHREDRYGTGERHYDAALDHDAEGEGDGSGVRSGSHRGYPGSFRAEQGHQERGAGPTASELGPRARDQTLLRDGQAGRVSRDLSGTGVRASGHGDGVRGLAYMHTRRTGRVRDRHREYGPGSRDLLRGTLVQSAGLDEIRGGRKAGKRSVLEGPDPPHHLEDRCGRRSVQGDGVHGTGHRGSVHRSADDHDEYGDRGGGEERDHRRGREGDRVRAGPDR